MGSILALVRKDLLVTRRAPLFALVSVLVPVAFTLLYAIVIHVSTTSTIAVADEDRSPESARFIEVMEGLRNDDGHYYEILTTDPGAARIMYEGGQAGAMLTIPPGFGEQVASGDNPALTLSLININSDGTKNQHIRLEEALHTFQAGLTTAPGRLTIVETTTLGRDIPISVYLGSALIVFAALYAGMINVGTGICREWEDRTAKELVLSPYGSRSLLAGKWTSGAVTSLATLAVTVAVIGWVLGYPVSHLGWRSCGVIALVWAYGAALGTLLAVALRRSLPLVPVAVIVCVGHFLLSGYESYVRGFAHGGVVEPLWLTTRWIPLAQLFDSVRFEVSGLPQPPGGTFGIVGSILLAAAFSTLAAWRITRTHRFTQGQ